MIFSDYKENPKSGVLQQVPNEPWAHIMEMNNGNEEKAGFKVFAPWNPPIPYPAVRKQGFSDYERMSFGYPVFI